MIKDSTRLSPHPLTGTYDYLPDSWNLLKCFEYYLEQKELWTTESIKKELAPKNIDTFPENLPIQDELFIDSNEDQEDVEEGEKRR